MPVQSEAALENGLIDTLQKMNYEYVHIEEEKNLSANFKKQLEIQTRRNWKNSVALSLLRLSLKRYSSILKVALALRRQRNFVTSFRLNLKVVNACGWSS